MNQEEDSLKQKIYHATLDLDIERVRTCLKAGADVSLTYGSNGETLLHLLSIDCPAPDRRRERIAYAICDADRSVLELENDEFRTPLQTAFLHEDLELIRALLRCGADVSSLDSAHIDLDGIERLGDARWRRLDAWRRSRGAASTPPFDVSLRRLLADFSPGYWKAVALGDIGGVRKLVNAWCCFVDASRDGVSVIEFSEQKGNAEISLLLKQVSDSMSLAHHVLAGNVAAARELMERRGSEVMVDFRNMGDAMATPLFYALEAGDLEMARLLLDRGAKIEARVVDEETGDDELPLFFRLLASGVSPSTTSFALNELVGEDGKSLHRLVHRGKAASIFAVENRLPVSSFTVLLSVGGSSQVAFRDSEGRTPRDIAKTMETTLSQDGRGISYVDAIDQIVVQWFQNDDFSFQELAFLGYDHLESILSDLLLPDYLTSDLDSPSPNLDDDDDSWRDASGFRLSFPSDFTRMERRKVVQVHRIWENIGILVSAVENGDLSTLRRIFRDCRKIFLGPRSLNGAASTPSSGLLKRLLLLSRQRGDGQTILHKAALRGNAEVVKFLVGDFVHLLSPDEYRDSYFRTPLHYAMASSTPEAKRVVDILLDFGASDQILDKDGVRPTDLEANQGSEDNRWMLKFHLDNRYDVSESEFVEMQKEGALILYSPDDAHLRSRATSTRTASAAPEAATKDAGKREAWLDGDSAIGNSIEAGEEEEEEEESEEEEEEDWGFADYGIFGEDCLDRGYRRCDDGRHGNHCASANARAISHSISCDSMDGATGQIHCHRSAHASSHEGDCCDYSDEYQEKMRNQPFYCSIL